MDSFASLQDVANLVVFVAPGYFSLRTYSLIYSKDEKEFARVLIESIACSLPIVSLYNFWWELIAGGQPATVLDIQYVSLLLGFSILVGFGFSYLRRWLPVKRLMNWLHLREPDEDFIELLFRKLGKNDVVTVTLKSGAVFSGMPKRGNSYKRGEARQYYFNNIAWYNKGNHKWEYRDGDLIIDLSEVEYMETSRPLPAG